MYHSSMPARADMLREVVLLRMGESRRTSGKTHGELRVIQSPVPLVSVQRPLPVHRALKPLQVLLLAGQLYPFAKWQRVASTYVKALAKRRVRLVYVWVPGRIEHMRAQHPVGNWSVSEC